jgi:hypothetical protein
MTAKRVPLETRRRAKPAAPIILPSPAPVEPTVEVVDAIDRPLPRANLNRDELLRIGKIYNARA